MATRILSASTRAWYPDPMYPLRYVSPDDGTDLGYLFTEASTLPQPMAPQHLSGWMDNALAVLRGDHGTLLDACSFVIEARGSLMAAILVVKRDDQAWIQQLAVQPLHQRQGIGSLLLAAAVDALHACQYSTVYVATEPNAPHTLFLTQHGFSEHPTI